MHERFYLTNPGLPDDDSHNYTHLSVSKVNLNTWEIDEPAESYYINSLQNLSTKETPPNDSEYIGMERLYIIESGKSRNKY